MPEITAMLSFLHHLYRTGKLRNISFTGKYGCFFNSFVLVMPPLTKVKLHEAKVKNSFHSPLWPADTDRAFNEDLEGDRRCNWPLPH